jgi:predicted deacylase
MPRSYHEIDKRHWRKHFFLRIIVSDERFDASSSHPVKERDIAMTSQESRIFTDIDYERDGFQKGTLNVHHSVDRSAYGHIRVPIAVLKNGEGPTVLLTGGNHGDEYEGPVALMKLLQRLTPASVHGRIIVVPGLNFPAFLAGTRTSPIDHANMNRVFPGKREGTVTELIAHYAETELFTRADFIFDMHSGGKSLNHLATLLVYPPAEADQRRDYLRLVQDFAAPFAMIMDHLGEDRTSAAAAERHGKVFLSSEFGGFGTVNPDGLAVAEEGLARLLNGLGVVRGEPVPAPRFDTTYIKVAGPEHYVFADVPGIFEPTVRLGETVTEGQLAGRIFNPHAPWSAPLEVRIAANGIVVCIRSHAGVEPGDCLVLSAERTTLAQA